MNDWFRLLTHVVRATLRADRRAATVLCGLLVGQAGVIAAIGLSQRALVDGGAAGDTGRVVAAVAVGALAYAVMHGTGRVASNLELYLVGRVRVAQNEEIQRIVSSIPTITHLEHGPHIDRWNRILQSSQALAAMPWSALRSVVTVLGLVVTVGLLVSVSPWLCLLAAFGVPLYFASRRADGLVRDARDAAAETLRREQRLHELCVEPGPAKEVLVSGGAAAWSAEAARLWESAAAREAAARLRGALWQGAAWALYAAAFAGALTVVAGLIRSGRASVGAAVLVVTLAVQLLNQLRTVLESLAVSAEAGQVVSHWWWLRRYAAAARRSGGAAPPVLSSGIEVTGVCFRYPGAGHDVLHDVTLRLPAGGVVAVVGPNGAGKTTLIKLLTGLHEPTTGHIAVDGVPLSDVDADAWRARLTGVYQDFARLRLKVRETVGIGDVTRVRDATAVRDAIGRAVAEVPFGLETRLGAEFGGPEPSLGQWQRLALARSLMREDRAPLCIVLDEPTAALDPLAEHELFRHFVGQVRAATGRGAVTVLVAHRFTTVRMADHIVVLDEGRVVEQGSHAELMAAGGGYAELYRLQERAYR